MPPPARFLLYFKYADFFIENFNKVTGAELPLLRLALPVGISFYIRKKQSKSAE